MGLLEGREKSRNEGQGGNSQSAVVPWQRPLCAPSQHLVSLPASSPPAHLPCPGHPGSPPRPRKPCVALRVSAMGVLVGALCWGWKKLVFSRDSCTGTLTCGRVTFHFPPCWEITWFFLKWITSLNPRFSSRNMGTILFSTFLPTLNTLRLNCRFSVILPSQVKARKEIRSIPPARTLAHLLSCGPQVGTLLCFRDVC